jgi:predicted nuclease of predicted toxin-antitoxin system
MKFLLDESADFPLAHYLQELGHDVTSVGFDHEPGLSDQAVLSIAYNERRILIANDRDFGELIFYQRLSHAGVILFRLGNETLDVKRWWLKYVLDHHAADLGQFIVITDRRVRVRRMDMH